MTDHKFKIVYPHWLKIKDKEYPIANGLPLKIVEWMKSAVNDDMPVNGTYWRIPDLEQDFLHKDSGVIFQHANLLYYFRKHYSEENIVNGDDIDENDEFIYFLPIEMFGSNINYIYYGYEFVFDGTTYQYDFFETLSPKIQELIQKGKIKLLFTALTEFTYSEDTLSRNEDYFRSKGVAGDTLCFLQGNYRIDYYPKNLGTTRLGTSHATLEQQVNIAKRYPIERSSLGYYCDYVRESDLDSSKLRPKKFLSWNRTMNRAHRIGLCALAFKYDLFSQGTFSFLNFISNHPVYDLQSLFDESEEELEKIVEKVRSIMPYQIDTHDLTEYGRETFQTNENNKKEIYADCYLHITSETHFNNHGSPFLSEKTFRPILNLQPFIYIGNYKSLEELKRLGFKTFHPFIDESYDVEQDPKVRWAKIEQEIKKFVDMPIEQIHDWYYSITDILLHNQRRFFEFSDYNPLEDFFSTFTL